MIRARTRTLSTANAAALTNRLANRLLIPLLDSTLGARLGRRLAVLDYVGRRTGRHHRLVVGYVAQGRTVRVTVGMAEHKTWWRNFATPHPLTLRLAGIDHHVFATAHHEGGRTYVIADLEFTDHPEVPANGLPADSELPSHPPHVQAGARDDVTASSGTPSNR
jgi:hypothetical protein